MARPRKNAEKAAAVQPVAARKGTRKRKTRVGNVRNLILKALASGSKTRPALQKATGASYNALIMHLATLRQEKAVEMDSSNRLVSLVGGATSADTARPAKKPATKAASKPPASTLPQLASESPVVGYSPRHLNEALDALTARFKPIAAVDEKVLVLDQLAVQIGGPVGHVLSAIKADLQRLSHG